MYNYCYFNNPNRILMSRIDINSENELLRKASEGNEQAFKQLFLKYHNSLGLHIFRITNSMVVAEEIVQDVFLKIWMSREALAGVHNFKAYLFVISKNHTLNCLRKLTKERQQRQLFEETIIRELTPESNVNIYHSLLDDAIDQLPPQQQLVYILSRHNRLKYIEVANRLNISHESVKKYLQIATSSITSYVHLNLKKDILFLIFLILF
jgi:RNA polymerase sigma-70 factor (family 1)